MSAGLGPFASDSGKRNPGSSSLDFQSCFPGYRERAASIALTIDGCGRILKDVESISVVNALGGLAAQRTLASFNVVDCKHVGLPDCRQMIYVLVYYVHA